MKKITNGDTLYHTNDFHFLNSKISAVEELSETKLRGLSDLISMQFSAMKIANELAAENLHIKLNEMNKFREETKNLQNTFLPIERYELQHDVLLKDIKEIREAKALSDGELKGKADIGSMLWLRWGFIITSALTLMLIILRLSGK